MNRKKKGLLPTSLIVTQSNQLVEARYNLPLAEQRLILTMISRIQPDDEDFKPYRISVGELADFLGVDRASAYRECKKTTENLLKRVVNIEEADGLLQVGWVSSAKYIDGAGIVNLSFDPLLKPYLLQLKGNFTSSKLEMLLSFKSQYTIRIYALLKQYEKLKEREVELDTLREILGLKKEQYQLYADFRRYVLMAVHKELDKKADLYFEYEEIKHGRKIGAIRFLIFSKVVNNTTLDKKNEIVSLENSNNQLAILIGFIPKQHRTKKIVLTCLDTFEKKFGFDYVKRNIIYCNEKAEKSYPGYLSSALKNDWGHDWELVQQEIVQKKPVEIWERNGFSNEKEYDEHMYRKQMESYKKHISAGVE